MVLHSERWTLTDDFHQPQHSDPPPRLVCLGTPLATCALPTGVFYLLTYLRVVNASRPLTAPLQDNRLQSPTARRAERTDGTASTGVRAPCLSLNRQRDGV